ncbi:MAG TPA: hypothetical protein VLS90_07625 [Thermodesulfobacteriota bacterium]|nr:hypothetical protein [Thermodesulfobacteriota bacterium]
MVQRLTTHGPKDDYLEFSGRDYAESLEKMNDAFLDWGWSDGFPVLPPTEEAVQKMLQGTRRGPNDTIIEKFVPGMARASVRNIAINAVMAGCKPEFLPVVMTAIEAMHDPVINLRLVSMSTGAHAPLFIVNGPIVEKLKINYGLCALGPAGPQRLSFPNVVIGRAVRLCLQNIGNCYPGIMDQDTIGTPNKFSLVLAENAKGNPWETYQVEKGFSAEDSTVSCGYGVSLMDARDLESDTAAGLMNAFARYLIGASGIISRTPYRYRPLILLAPDHARILAREGWTKNDIREYIHLHCTLPAEHYRRSSQRPVEKKWIEAAECQAAVPLYEDPKDVEIVVVGGMAGKSATYSILYPANPHLIKS